MPVHYPEGMSRTEEYRADREKVLILYSTALFIRAAADAGASSDDAVSKTTLHGVLVSNQ